MKILPVLLLILFPLISLSSMTRLVKQDGTGDYTTIQSAINGCNNGDIILVYPGRYLENLNLNSKQNITLASLEYTTGDPSYIGQTIIDGHHVETCIKIMHGEQNILIQGFVITNGNALNTILDYCSFGGGIYLSDNTQVTIRNCSIYNNTASDGGGIFNNFGNLTLSNVSIHNNSSDSGGGLSCYRGVMTFDSEHPCSLYNNTAGNGMDIVLSWMEHNTVATLDTVTVNPPGNFYIRCINASGFSSTIIVSALHGYRQEVNNDLYVSPYGNDENSGVTSDSPLKTISWALRLVASDSLNPKKVYLAPGVYSSSQDEYIYPIPMKSFVSIIGDNEEDTILLNSMPRYTFGGADIEHFNLSNVRMKTNNQVIPGYLGLSNSDFIEFSHITADSCNSSLYSFFIGETLSNLIFDHILVLGANGPRITSMNVGEANFKMKDCSFRNIISNYDPRGMQAIFCFSIIDSVVIENTSFINCQSRNEGASVIYIDALDDYQSNNNPIARISNCLFANNSAQYNPVFSTYSYVDLTSTFNNCTFINNTAGNSMPTLHVLSNSVIRNSIFDNSTFYEITLTDTNINAADYRHHLFNNDIVGGQTQVHEYSGTGHVTWHEGNIFDNPSIAGGDLNDPLSYRLSSDSPCIDTGTPDTTGLFLPLADLAGNYRIWNNRVDIGCYEYGSEPVGNDDHVQSTFGEHELSNYPNPFNPSTTISYSLKDNVQVSLDIYNIRGQLVKRLVHEKQTSGKHSIVWDGREESNTSCASGVYLYKLKTGNTSILRKMLMLK